MDAYTTPTSFALAKSLPAGQGLASLILAAAPDGAAAPLPEGCNIQLFPDGEFAAIDGRPGNDPKNKTKVWRMDAAIAAALIADLNALQTPRPLDYEHQTVNADRNGQPAPASGWLGNYTYIAGRGLFAWADWTAKAKAHIEAGEYRYISPTFSYCRNTGRVMRLYHAALTNFPALDGMAPVAATTHQVPDGAATVTAGAIFSETQQPEHFTEDYCMDELKKELGLPATATEAEVMAALAALRAKAAEAEAAQAEAKAAATQSDAHLDALATLTAQVAELNKRDNERKLDDAIAAAKRAGKLTSALEPWARELGARDMAALTAYFDKVQPLAALQGMQTDGKEPEGESGTASLTAEEKYAADQLGLSHEDYAKAKEAK